MLYLSGTAGGTGDGTAVTERETRADAWKRRAPGFPAMLPIGLPPPNVLNGMMGMGGNPFAGIDFGGGRPMLTGWEHHALLLLQLQQQDALRAFLDSTKKAPPPQTEAGLT